ncbi:MAG TPA: ATP-binding cassette domain-containing protein [Desulfitobacteriaceae bacterium]|nr:ATP-binding cassette domain-containing protein [Desulfitobacteriaceae bacterium]
MMLEIENLSKRFGGLVALDEVSLEFASKTVTAIIGSNGAGKTTLFSVIAGFQKPDSGRVILKSDDVIGNSPRLVGMDITAMTPDRIALQGIGVLFQDVRVFDKLTALANVAVGAKNQPGENPFNCVFRPKLVAVREKEVLEKSLYYLDYVGLADKAHLWAEQLSYGQQKLLAIARLLAGDSKVLLLDEPTSGVHPDMIDKLLLLIQQLANDDGRAVIMIEHNLNVVKRIGDLVYLMAGGRIEAFGKPPEVLCDEKLVETLPML